VGAIIGVLITGRLGDWLIERHHLTARPLVGGVAFLLAAVLFLPGLLTTSLLVAAPLFFLAAAGIGGANPPLDAARRTYRLIYPPSDPSGISAERKTLRWTSTASCGGG